MKTEGESKARKTKESIYTIKFRPYPKRENKTYGQFKDKLNFDGIRKSKDVLSQLMKYEYGLPIIL